MKKKWILTVYIRALPDLIQILLKQKFLIHCSKDIGIIDILTPRYIRVRSVIVVLEFFQHAG